MWNHKVDDLIDIYLLDSFFCQSFQFYLTVNAAFANFK